MTFNALSADGKAVSYASLDGHLVCTRLADYTYTFDSLVNAVCSRVTTPSITGTYVPAVPDSTSYTYNWYETLQKPSWTAGGSGRIVIPFSNSCFIRSLHLNLGDSFTTVAGANYTAEERISLTDYAAGNHLDLPNGLTDIELIYKSGTSITDDQIPYFIPHCMIQGMLHKDNISQVFGWNSTTVGPDGQPIWFRDPISNGQLQWTTPVAAGVEIPDRSDLEYLKSQILPTWLGTSGVSGKPVYLRVGSEEIVVSHAYQAFKPTDGTVGAPYCLLGPDYTKAYPILKHFAEKHDSEIKTYRIV